MRANRVARFRGFGLALGVGLLIASGAAAAGPDRSHPPAPGPLPHFQVPVPRGFTLSSGLPVLVVPRHRVGVVDVILVVRAGAAADPAELPGLASWTAQLLTEGAAGRSALEFADAVDFLGARLSASAGWDSTRVHLHAPVARIEPALALLGDAVLHPDFPEPEWKRLRARRRTAFLEARSDPRRLLTFAVARALFGPAHRFGSPVGGTPQALEHATLGGVRRFHRTWYRPDNAFLVVVGNLTSDDARRVLDRVFGAWKVPEAVLPGVELPRPRRIRKREIVLVDRPGSAQSVVAAVGLAPPDLLPLDPAVKVMNTLLGGSFTSRLNTNLREEHGYSYGAGSRLDERRAVTSFAAMASVATGVTAPAVREIVRELDRIRTPTPAEDAERARTFAALTFPNRFETCAGIATFWTWMETMGVPVERATGFMAAAARVDGKAIRTAARRVVEPRRMKLVIVGDRSRVEEPLRKLRLGPVRVWSVDDLLPGDGKP